MHLIHITTGDPDGIGLEVALKALNNIGPIQGVQFVLWHSRSSPKEMFSLLNKQFKIRSIKESELKTQDNHNLPENILWDLALPERPTQWVAKAGELCLKNPQKEALVTAPLSKTQMQKEGFEERGHTDLLKKISKASYVYMCFLGDYFNVTLLTGHVPLKKVQWSQDSLNRCIKLCLYAGGLKIHVSHLVLRRETPPDLLQKFPEAEPSRQVLPAPNQFGLNQAYLQGVQPVMPLSGEESLAGQTLPAGHGKSLAGPALGKKIGVLGLNPHAGENGLLGKEETLLKKVLTQWKGQVEGPLVPDTAFFKENWPRFFMYICLYHDQGLIPFKMVHGRNSFQLSLGLNFMRVSVSHGTAKDIYGQNKADPESMTRALLKAIRLVSGRLAQDKSR